MKVSYVIGAFALSKATHAAIGDGSEHHDHESFSVVGGSSTVTEVIWTDVNTFTSIISGVASDSVTRVLATTTSVITKTATGIPGTAKYGENTTGVVTSAALSETTSSVGSTASSMSSAFTDIVVTTETDEAVGGTSTSTGSFSGVNSTLKLTTTVVVTTALPPLTSTVNWTSNSMASQPVPVTSTETSTSSITDTLPLSILATADVVKTSSVASREVASDTAISSPSSEENEATSILSTSTSTFTIVVTGPTRTHTTTVRTGRKPSTSTTIFTSAAECVPKTVLITVGAGHPSLKPVEAATSSVITSSTVKSVTSSAPYAITNSTTLNSGVGATCIPHYKNLTTGTGGLDYTSATNPAKAIFTGGAVNMLDHKKCLAEIAAGLAVLFSRRFV